MAWLKTPVRVAAELAPAVWTFAAAERRRGLAPRLVGARAIAATGAALVDDVRAFRRAAKLPMDVRVILWPHEGDAGVGPIESRDAAAVEVPKARVIRDRVAPLVRAGGLVAEVLLPHECLARVAATRELSSACVIVAHAGLTCIGVVSGSAVQARYLRSAPPPASFASESARLLARYQHIALLAPHVRDMGGAAAGMRVLVAGTLPGLRGAMVPLVEELDHEIDVLDADLPSAAPSAADHPGVVEALDADEIAGLQLAWAVAATRDA